MKKKKRTFPPRKARRGFCERRKGSLQKKKIPKN